MGVGRFMTTWVLLHVCGALAVQTASFGQVPQAPSPSQAPDPAFAAVADDPSLPRVLLIGDSISIGYTLPTRALLHGKANVHRIAMNGGPTINGLAHIDEWLGAGPWAVIHFNWGLHDLRFMEDGKHQVAVDAYEANLRTLVQRLRRTGARLIWASTTPVPDAKVSPPRKSSDVLVYNAAAQRVMQEYGIPIDDLYAVALPRLGEIQRAANVHFTEPGYGVLAEHVAASIRQELAASR